MQSFLREPDFRQKRVKSSALYFTLGRRGSSTTNRNDGSHHREVSARLRRGARGGRRKAKSAPVDPPSPTGQKGKFSRRQRKKPPEIKGIGRRRGPVKRENKPRKVVLRREEAVKSPSRRSPDSPIARAGVIPLIQKSRLRRGGSGRRPLNRKRGKTQENRGGGKGLKTVEAYCIWGSNLSETRPRLGKNRPKGQKKKEFLRCNTRNLSSSTNIEK